MDELTRDIVDAEHYVARYVRGGLSEGQREAFEDFCVLHPDVAAQVETDRAFLTGLRGLNPEPWVERARPVWRYAMAAGIAIIVVAIGVIAYRESASGPSLALYADAKDLNPLALSGLSTAFVVSPVRGGRTLVLRVHDDVHALRVNFDPGLHDANEFDFKLIEHTANGDIDRGSVRGAVRQVDGDSVVPLFIDLGASREPHLRLEVEFAGSRETFELRVVRQ